MAESPLTVSVIIPTMNRPKDLERCIRSIVAQTRLPDELLVVDDGELDPAAVESLLRDTPIRFLYVKKDRRGLARSRNVGVSRASGDIIVFLDDDTELDPTYLSGYLDIFATDTGERIGGISGAPTRYLHGVPIPDRPPMTIPLAIERLFLLSSSHGGHVLPSGFRSPMITPDERTPVDYLQGGNMALRRRVFEEFSFDEELDKSGGYSLGEDVFFSYPVGKKYQLFSTSRSRLKHFATPGNRPNKRDMNRMRVIHQYRFMRRTMNGGPLNVAAFAWSMVGLVVLASLNLVRRPDSTRWKNLEGLLSGIAHVVRDPNGDHVV